MPFSQTSVIEIAVFGHSATGQNVFNIFHYRQTDTTAVTYDNEDLENAVTDFNTNWVTHILPTLSVDYTYQTIRARALTGTIANPTPPPPNVIVVGEQFDFVLGVPNGGAIAGEALPSYSAVGIQKLSSRAGRNFRGGARFGTVSSDDVIVNDLTAGIALPRWTTAGTNFYAATLALNFGANLWEMAIMSRTLVLAAPPPFTDLRALTAKVIGAKVNPFISSQVSRKQSPTQPT